MRKVLSGSLIICPSWSSGKRRTANNAELPALSGSRNPSPDKLAVAEEGLADRWSTSIR